uniref:Uncharacterized protein n=1 Tax=Physcomitrium patens TaxID=3218 RepID=A0A2K1KG37_PHYPA|nr:hypothetical protein PHYPA_009122 [Physcomitrium patens]
MCKLSFVSEKKPVILVHDSRKLARICSLFLKADTVWNQQSTMWSVLDEVLCVATLIYCGKDKGNSSSEGRIGGGIGGGCGSEQ